MASKKLNTSEAILGAGAKGETRGRKPFMDPSEKKNAQTTILLRPTTKQNMRDLAWGTGSSLNELINQACEEFMEKRSKELEAIKKIKPF